MQHKLVGVFTFCFLNFLAQAQNDADVLRYSMINYGSTARSLGMGNAFGALGADPSVMATNPGGLGLFRRSEFSFSPTFTLRNTTSDFLGEKTDENNFKFNFGNLAFIWAVPGKDTEKNWKGLAFGIGYNRLNDFSLKSFAQGVNHKNSLLDNYLDQVVKDQTDPTNFPNQYPMDIDLAWQTYLLDTGSDAFGPYIYSAIPAGGALQQRTVETKGGMGEWDFSVGANYMDNVYVGATLGFVSLNYREDIIWEEKDVNNTIASSDAGHNFKSYKYTQNLKVDGSGVNLKIGLIYRPNDYLRIGAAIHTPTFLNLTDEYKTSFTAQYEGGASSSANSPESLPFEYNINTPFRFIGSLGFIVGKYGLISADYEFVNYSNSDINPKDKSFKSDFIEANRAIKDRYTSSHNFRFGGELRYKELRFRLGGTYSSTPFSSGYNSRDADQSRFSVNGGLGIREENVYFDVGYSYSKTGSYEGVYTSSYGNAGAQQFKMDHRLMFTLGFNY